MKRLLFAGALAGLLWACTPDQPRDGDETAARATGSATPTAAAPMATPSASETGRVSQYTRTDNCKLLELEEEEGGYSLAACPGLAGYKLRLAEGDLRQSLVVETPGGSERSLDLAEATSGGFSRIGESIEWRGAVEDGRFHPDAMILRYFVVEDADRPENETSYLIAVSLAQGGPCVAGKLAPGPQQNLRARRMADGRLRCL
jgi:hypothetical protein